MIRIEVETLVDKDPIDEGCYVQSDPIGGLGVVKKRSEDRYEAILGDGKAWVSVPVIETQGGPGYSSIKIGVEIQVHCDQKADTDREVADMLTKDALEIVDTHIYNAYKILLQHRDAMDEELEKQYREEQNR